MEGDDDPVFHGVRLEHHAGVSAALAEGISLEEVLAQEEIAKRDWDEANPRWRSALVSSPDLQTKYVQKRRVAEDALARPIKPVDDDPEAWAGLLGAVNTADDARSVLEPLGLRASDLARLGRAWTKKAKADPEVQKKLTDAAGKAPPPKSVKADPVKLKPFPWTKKKGAAAPEPPAVEAPKGDGAGADGLPIAELARAVDGVLPVERDLDLYAAMSVVLQLAPNARGDVLRLLGLSEARFAAMGAAWRKKLDTDADLNAELVVRAGDHREALRKLLSGARGSLGSGASPLPRGAP